MNTRQKSKRKAVEPTSLPKSTHAGTVEMLGAEMTCYLLDDGRGLLSQCGVNKFFLCTNGGRNNLGLPRFAMVPPMVSFLARKVKQKDAKPVEFIDSRSGRKMTAIDATLVADVCEAWMRARDAGAVKTLHHLAVAYRAEVFLRGVARFGLMTHINDAVADQEVRRSR